MNVLEHAKLAEIRKNLLEEITLLGLDEFNRIPVIDMWSIAQVCHHLVLVEEATIKAIAWGLKKESTTEKERKNLVLLLDRSRKYKAPTSVEPSEGPFEVQEIIDLLSESRNKLMTFLTTIEDKSILLEKTVKHPGFGELTLDQWVDQIHFHEQRHIDQIKEIKVLLAT